MSAVDLIAAAVLLTPAALGGVALGATWRASATDSEAVRTVLAESAAERAARAADAEEGGTPPPAREPAPRPAAEAAPARLAAVIEFPAHRRAA
ncbi:hypothetical protein BX265_3721 [Streptomyces sp. TLI_235]|nr:hypothetical protein [Streptomyces sp. TLI_235]PBC78929.1 hypothetical protein BX265_3721 [Streptomyces sp. TLI_235]